MFAFFSFMSLMSISGSGFDRWFTRFLDPEQTRRHHFPPMGAALHLLLKTLILFPAEPGIWLVPPPRSQFQTEVGKKPLFWRNSCCSSGKKCWSWNGYSKKMSAQRGGRGQKNKLLGVTGRDINVLLCKCGVSLHRAWFPSPPCSKDAAELVQRRVTGRIKGIEQLPCGEGLNRLGLFCLQSR